MDTFQKIITTAFRITFDTPVLWFFGLFLAGGFNVNWIYLFHTGLMTASNFDFRVVFHSLWFSPAIVVFLLFWVLVNWIKIGFVFNIATLTKTPWLGSDQDQSVEADMSIWQRQKKYLLLGKKALGSVVAMSLFTIIAQLLVSLVLAGPQLWWDRNRGMLVFAGVLFVAFMLFFSLLNFFAATFIIIYQKKFSEAFTLATQFLAARPTEIFSTSIALFLLYAAGVGVLISANSFFKDFILWFIAATPFIHSSMPALFLNNFMSLLLFLFLGFMNAFFNVGLFLIFKEYTKPQKFSEEESEIKSLASVSATPQ